MDRRDFLKGVLSSPLASLPLAARTEESAAAPISSVGVSSSSPAHAGRHIVLKIGTTGFDPAVDSICEIAAVQLIGGQVAGVCFHQRLRPHSERPTSPYVGSFGDPGSFLTGAPFSFVEVAPAFVCYLRGAHLVMHDADRDLAFIDKGLSDAGLGSLNTYCASLTGTLVLARQRFGPTERRSLQTLCSRLGLPPLERDIHDSAVAYAATVGQIYASIASYRGLHGGTHASLF